MHGQMTPDYECTVYLYSMLFIDLFALASTNFSHVTPALDNFWSGRRIGEVRNIEVGKRTVPLAVLNLLQMGGRERRGTYKNYGQHP